MCFSLEYIVVQVQVSMLDSVFCSMKSLIFGTKKTRMEFPKEPWMSEGSVF